jgi:cytoskeletal protein RodZ
METRPPDDLGAVLRDAREKRGRSLNEVAQVTRVRLAFLEAIEANRRDQLPDAIFLRGFVRAYAREVGLDPDEISRRYLAQFESPTANAHNDAAPPAISSSMQAELAVEAMHSDRRRSNRDQWAVILLLIAVTGGYAGYRWRTPSVAPASTQSATPAADVPSPPPGRVEESAETGTSGLQSSPPVEPVASEVIRLELTATESCWVSATVDGRRIAYRMMRPGEHQSLEVRDEAVLRIGEPAAMALSIDGAAGRSLGRPGEPVTLHITRENYREFLSH